MIINRFFFILSILFALPITSFSENDKFDRMRCDGKLITANSPLDYVLKHCGEPVNRRNWGNQYETQQHLYFKAPGESGCYYMYFEDNLLVDSQYRGYRGCQSKS